MLKLTDGFKERLAFNITNSSTDLNDSNLSICCSRITVETALDLICNMWDNLNSSAAKVTATFFRENGPIYFSGCYVGLFGQIFINETFVVAKIQVSLCTIIRNEHFTVLYRIHSTRVNIDIWIELLHCYTVSAHFEQSS